MLGKMLIQGLLAAAVIGLSAAYVQVQAESKNSAYPTVRAAGAARAQDQR